jgi:hypothetical protein
VDLPQDTGLAAAWRPGDQDEPMVELGGLVYFLYDAFCQKSRHRRFRSPYCFLFLLAIVAVGQSLKQSTEGAFRMQHLMMVAISQ